MAHRERVKAENKFVGAHVSSRGGVENAPLNASKIGARAFALFTGNQRRWQSKPLERKNIDLFIKNCEDAGYTPEYILPHDGYLINLGHPEREGLKNSRNAFLDEMKRCEQLGLKYLNFHPGSHLNKIAPNECLSRIAESINRALEMTHGVTAVIENTAGQGTNVGFRFEDIAEIIDRVEDKKRVGVCLDTCHAYSAGYDIKGEKALDGVMEEFDSIVGLTALKAMHLNDSTRDLSTRVDRHASIGGGTLGMAPFRYIMNKPVFDNIPMVLETPDETLWAREIRMLYDLIIPA